MKIRISFPNADPQKLATFKANWDQVRALAAMYLNRAVVQMSTFTVDNETKAPVIIVDAEIKTLDGAKYMDELRTAIAQKYPDSFTVEEMPLKIHREEHR